MFNYFLQFIEYINDTLEKDIARFDDLLFTEKRYSLDNETYYELKGWFGKLRYWRDTLEIFREKIINDFQKTPLEDKILPLIRLSEERTRTIESLEKQIDFLNSEIDELRNTKQLDVETLKKLKQIDREV